MGLLPTTRFSAASEPCGSACSDSGTAVTVSVTGPLDRVYHQALPLAVDSGCRPLFRDFTSCRTLTRAATRDVYSRTRRLPPSSRFFYFCRAQSALHGDQCLQHGDQLRHVRAPCNFLRLVIFKLTLLIITKQKTTKSTASQRVCDPTASTRPSLACDVSPAKVTVTMGEAEAASAAADVRRWSPCRNVFLASLALPVLSLSMGFATVFSRMTIAITMYNDTFGS